MLFFFSKSIVLWSHMGILAESAGRQTGCSFLLFIINGGVVNDAGLIRRRKLWRDRLTSAPGGAFAP